MGVVSKEEYLDTCITKHSSFNLFVLLSFSYTLSQRFTLECVHISHQRKELTP